jgi:hypothetical protein
MLKVLLKMNSIVPERASGDWMVIVALVPQHVLLGVELRLLAGGS